MTLNCAYFATKAVEGHFCSLLISNIIWLSSLSSIPSFFAKRYFRFSIYNSRQVRSTFCFALFEGYLTFLSYSAPSLLYASSARNLFSFIMSNKNRRSCSAFGFTILCALYLKGYFEGLLVHWFVPSFLCLYCSTVFPTLQDGILYKVNNYILFIT